MLLLHTINLKVVLVEAAVEPHAGPCVLPMSVAYPLSSKVTFSLTNARDSASSDWGQKSAIIGPLLGIYLFCCGY